jgi:hypothetical protein
MDPSPPRKARAGLRLGIWFGLTLLYLGAAFRAFAAQFTLLGPPVELSSSEWLSYVLPAIILFVLSLAPHLWPRPSRQMMAFGMLWFILGELILLAIV